jgi:hypothetical protein
MAPSLPLVRTFDGQQLTSKDVNTPALSILKRVAVEENPISLWPHISVRTP